MVFLTGEISPLDEILKLFLQIQWFLGFSVSPYFLKNS